MDCKQKQRVKKFHDTLKGELPSKILLGVSIKPVCALSIIDLEYIYTLTCDISAECVCQWFNKNDS